MAHWAEVDNNNIVIRVLVTNTNSPNEGYDWLIQNLGGTWIQTSYNATIRKHYAGIGFTYSEQLDAFIPPSPFESWELDETTCTWQAPIPYPDDGQPYRWEESTTSWVIIIRKTTGE